MSSIFLSIFIFFQLQLTSCATHLYPLLFSSPYISYHIQSFSNFQTLLLLTIYTLLPLYFLIFFLLSPLRQSSSLHHTESWCKLHLQSLSLYFFLEIIHPSHINTLNQFSSNFNHSKALAPPINPPSTNPVFLFLFISLTLYIFTNHFYLFLPQFVCIISTYLPLHFFIPCPLPPLHHPSYHRTNTWRKPQPSILFSLFFFFTENMYKLRIVLCNFLHFYWLVHLCATIYRL